MTNTLSLRKSVFSGKYRCMFPSNVNFNYKMDGEKFLVQHNVRTDVWIPLDRSDVHLDK
jgi:hypothetical protein